MSRLGDLILLERTRQKLTRKQVARKCGVSEGYIKDVEEGRRIIQDDQARRILKTLGTSQKNEAEFSLDEIAATVDLGTLAPAKPTPQPKADPPKPASKPVSAEEQSGIWLDALSSVLQPVPVMNAGWIQVARRMVPIQDGKIEGAKPERVVYFQAVEYGAHRCLRRIRLLGDSKILLQSGDRELDAQAMHINELKLVGRAVRIEIAL